VKLSFQVAERITSPTENPVYPGWVVLLPIFMIAFILHVRKAEEI
jgi:hypothetical protein